MSEQTYCTCAEEWYATTPGIPDYGRYWITTGWAGTLTCSRCGKPAPSPRELQAINEAALAGHQLRRPSDRIAVATALEDIKEGDMVEFIVDRDKGTTTARRVDTSRSTSGTSQ